MQPTAVQARTVRMLILTRTYAAVTHRPATAARFAAAV